MEPIQWKPDYDTGIERIDHQHQNLVKILNDIIKMPKMIDNNRNKQIEIYLKALLDYTIYHFDQEEALMKTAGYPDLEEHMEEHAVIRKKVEDFVHRFNNGDRFLDIPIVEFLKNWLLNHICHKDQDYVPHVKKSANDSLKSSK